jgi:hypothetical protein
MEPIAYGWKSEALSSKHETKRNGATRFPGLKWGITGIILNLLYIQLTAWYYIYVSYEELVVNFGSVANESVGL